MNKEDELRRIAEEIVAHDVCPGLRVGATQLVFGAGNPDADIVFIGEAPGRQEDSVGLPFVGASGKFLDEMLQSIHLDRADVYITNIVKYRPPNNRDPFPDEKETFWPYLVRQLDVIRPKLIVTLGRHSMEHFLPNKKISQIHGEPTEVTVAEYKFVLLPLYHPATALYNGSQREMIKADFMKIPSVLAQIN